MSTYTATDYEPATPGLYIASLQEIKDAQSQHAVYYRWRFVIEHEGRGVHAKVLRSPTSLLLCVSERGVRSAPRPSICSSHRLGPGRMRMHPTNRLDTKHFPNLGVHPFWKPSVGLYPNLSERFPRHLGE
jgi:hypothetical protein